MNPALAILLLANALFNVVVWPRFYRQIARDPRARTAEGKSSTYLIVHSVLVAIALNLAVASAITGIVALTS
ncbi:MAG: hypothetical protein H7248_11355 [Microbacteriaceae bacterium]|nr:hypothetical protein [Microbacteriaceae bacterium]